MRIKIPDEISIVGNDDIPFSRHIPVQLTTIRAPIFEMGKKATEILIRNIESSKPLQVENVVFEAEFIVRQSTKALRSIHTNQREGNFELDRLKGVYWFFIHLLRVKHTGIFHLYFF
jgi:hypothetical protein